jgi:hypothetical protein
MAENTAKKNYNRSSSKVPSRHQQNTRFLGPSHCHSQLLLWTDFQYQFCGSARFPAV